MQKLQNHSQPKNIKKNETSNEVGFKCDKLLKNSIQSFQTRFSTLLNNDMKTICLKLLSIFENEQIASLFQNESIQLTCNRFIEFLNNFPKQFFLESEKNPQIKLTMFLKYLDIFFHHIQYSTSVLIDLECSLLNLSYMLKTDEESSFNLFSLYFIYDELISINDLSISIKSSSMFYSTKLLPFVMNIRTLKENMKVPFFILIFSNKTQIHSLIDEYKYNFKNTVEIVTSNKILKQFYTQNSFQKPIFGLLTQIKFIQLFLHFESNLQLFLSLTRFCLIDVEDRTIETDTIIDLFSQSSIFKKLNGLKLILMSNNHFKIYCDKFNIKTFLSNDYLTTSNIIHSAYQCNSISEINSQIVECFSLIIENFSSNKFKVGDILTYFSKYNDCQLFLKSISKNQNHNLIFLKIQEKEDLQEIYKDIDLQIQHTLETSKLLPNTIFAIPIIISHLIPKYQLVFAQHQLPAFLTERYKIIKIISTTNLFESYLNIENVSAVIDSGLFDFISTDDKNITFHSEALISERLKNLRYEKVNRFRTCLYFEFNLKDHPRLSEIQISSSQQHFSQSILNLSRAGMKINSMNNSFVQIDQQIFNNIISKFISLKIFDQSLQPTEFGLQCSRLHDISPFYAAVVLFFSKCNLFNLIFSSLVIFIINMDSGLILDPLNHYLCQNFCSESDIVTILKTFLMFYISFIQNKSTFFPSQYGFNNYYCQIIIRQFSDLLNKFIIQENIIDVLYDLFSLQTQQMIFKIDQLIETILLIQPDFLDSHRFFLIHGFFENSSKGAIYQKLNSPDILQISQRPGSEKWIFPFDIFVFSIHQYKPQTFFSTFLIHRGRSDYFIRSHKILIKNIFSNPFTYTLLNSYWTNTNKLIPIFNHSNCTKVDFLNYFLFNTFNDQVEIVYIPYQNFITKEILLSINVISKLMPFVPRSIIILNETPHSVVEICKVGEDFIDYQYSFQSNLHNFPNAYHCNRNTIQFLYQQLPELSSTRPSFRFSLTGESFFHLLNDKENSSNSHIQYQSSFTDVFISNENHLLILTNSEITIPNELSVQWNYNLPEIILKSNTSNLNLVASKLLPFIFSGQYFENKFSLEKRFDNFDSIIGAIQLIKNKENISSLQLLLKILRSFSIPDRNISSQISKIIYILKSKFGFSLLQYQNVLSSLKKFANFLNCFSQDFFSQKSILKNIGILLHYFDMFLNFIQKSINNQTIVNLECSLFDMCYKLIKEPKISFVLLDMYSQHNLLINSSDPLISLSSPYGSGKTSFVPIFMTIRSFKENIKIPFFILVLPNKKQIISKLEEFSNNLKNTTEIITNYKDLHKMYSKTSFEKPIFGLLTPIQFLKLLKPFGAYKNLSSSFLQRTRICLDDIDERTIEQDILVGIYSSQLRGSNLFGLMFTIMSITTPQCYIEKLQAVEYDVNNELPFIYKVDCNSFAEVKYKASDMFNLIIQKFISKQIKIGNVVAFFSQHQDCQFFLEITSKNCLNDVIFLQFQPKDNLEEIVKNIEIQIKLTENKSDRTIFVIPIVVSNAVSTSQISFAQYPIYFESKYNVIKLIVATNFLESSLKFDNLSSIIDTGLFISSEFSYSNGIPIMTESLIPESTRIQRLRQLNQNGFFVQFEYRGQQRPFDLFPKIFTQNFVQTILNLHRIGLNIELIENLTNYPSMTFFQKIRTNMISENILNLSGNLLDFGIKCSQLKVLDPFYSAAILRFSKDNISDFIFGSLVFLIISSDPQLIFDPKNVNLCNNFCQESDLVTIVKTFLVFYYSSISQTNITPSQYGFNDFYCNLLFEQFTYIMKKYIENHHHHKIIEELISIEPKVMINKIDILISDISSKQKLFVQFRQVSFEKVFVERFSKGAFYKCLTSIEDIKAGTILKVYPRPGTDQWIYPSNAYLLSIQKNNSSGIFNSFLIHRFPTNFNLITPKTVQAKFSCRSPFFVVLFCSYWAKSNKLAQINYNPGSTKSEFMAYIHVDIFDDKAELTFYPFKEQFIPEIQTSINSLAKLMPFVPRSVIAYSETPPALLEIYNVGGDYSSFQYPIKPNSINLPNAYHCNQHTINFLLERISELSSNQPNFRFAFTGESFFQSFDDDDQRTKAGWLIQYDESFPTVFIPNGNHLVILSNAENIIPQEKSLQWTSEVVSNQFESNAFNLISAASKVFPFIITARYIQNVYIVKSYGAYFSIDKGFLNPEVSVSDVDIIHGNIPYILNQIRLSLVENEMLQSPIQIKSFTSESYSSPRVDEIYQRLQTSFGFEKKDINVFQYGSGAYFISLPRSDKISQEIIQDNFNRSFYMLQVQSVIPISSFVIYHSKNLGLEQNEFVRQVQNVINRFGFLVLWSSKYEELKTKFSHKIGFIRVKLLDSNFAIVFAKEVRQALLNNTSELTIPTIPSILQQSKYFDGPFQQWMQKHKITLIRSENNLWRGKTNQVENALNLLKNNPIEMKHAMIPFRFVLTSKFRDEINTINQKFIQENKFGSRWEINYNPLSLIVPIEDTEKAKTFISQYTDVDDIWDPGFCDDPFVSRIFLLVYEENGDFESKPFCMDCQIEILKNSIHDFAPNGKLNSDILALYQTKIPSLQVALSPHDKIHHLPIGQLLWQLIHCGDEIESLTRLWVTGVFSVSLRTNPAVFTSCPIHPRIIHLTPTEDYELLSCPVPGCNMNYCQTKCHEWHKDVCNYIWPGPKCPKCHIPTFKNQGCNHITCPCGAHWCYKCGAGPFQNASLTYGHMDTNHCW